MIFNFKKFKRHLNEGWLGSKKEAPYGDFHMRNRREIDSQREGEDVQMMRMLSGTQITVNRKMGFGEDLSSDMVSMETKVMIDRRGVAQKDKLHFTIEGKERAARFMIRYSGTENIWTFFKTGGISFPVSSMEEIIFMVREIYETTGESLPVSFYKEFHDMFKSNKEVSTTLIV